MADSSEDDYLDPRFERPWIQSAATLEENIRLEKQEIAKVRDVIVNFVGEMAKRRKRWRAEFDRLQLEFRGTTHTPSILTPLRRKRYRRYTRLERTFSDLPPRESYATRDVHRKTHGCLAGTFRIRDDLETDLAKGLFRPGATYDAVVRFSNASPKAQADSSPDGRGMAVKLLSSGTLPNDDDPEAVVKQWLRGHKDQRIVTPEINRKGLLDILCVNFPVFFINSPPGYARVNQAFLHISDDEDAFFAGLITFINTALFQGMSAWERQLAAAGSIIYNPLYQKYYSMAPSRLGSRDDPGRKAVKYVWEPRRGEAYDELIKTNNPPWSQFNEHGHPIKGLLNRLAVPPEVKQNRDHLRSMVARSLDPRVFEQDRSRPPVSFELRVQEYIDDTQTPVEDATSIWLESEEQRVEWLHRFQIPREEQRAVRSRVIAPLGTVGVLTISPLPLSEIASDRSRDGLPGVRNHECCEDLSFNPWNNVPEEHRPLGIVQRMKREVYAGSRNTRFKENEVENVFLKQ